MQVPRRYPDQCQGLLILALVLRLLDSAFPIETATLWVGLIYQLQDLNPGLRQARLWPELGIEPGTRVPRPNTLSTNLWLHYQAHAVNAKPQVVMQNRKISTLSLSMGRSITESRIMIGSIEWRVVSPRKVPFSARVFLSRTSSPQRWSSHPRSHHKPSQ